LTPAPVPPAFTTLSINPQQRDLLAKALADAVY